MKRSKKVCLSFCVTFILLFTVSLCCPIYAAEYGGQYPPYLEQSGSCFIECQTNLGRGTIVVPLNYTNDTFGFYGDGSQVMNLTSYTISGYFVTQSGITYGYINSSPLFPTFINNYKKKRRQKEIENMKAQEAYERIVEEQAALEDSHRLYSENQQKAVEFFKHNPGRYKVTIDKMDFYNDDKVPWYMKTYTYNSSSSAESSKPSYDLDEAVRKATVRAKDMKD